MSRPADFGIHMCFEAVAEGYRSELSPDQEMRLDGVDEVTIAATYTYDAHRIVARCRAIGMSNKELAKQTRQHEAEVSRALKRPLLEDRYKRVLSRILDVTEFADLRAPPTEMELMDEVVSFGIGWVRDHVIAGSDPKNVAPLDHQLVWLLQFMHQSEVENPSDPVELWDKLPRAVKSHPDWSRRWGDHSQGRSSRYQDRLCEIVGREQRHFLLFLNARRSNTDR